MVKKEMETLQRMGIGHLKTVDRSMVFYKTTPDTVDVAELETLDCSHEQYTDIFNSQNTGLAISQKQAALENHPNGEAYRRYMSSLTELVELADCLGVFFILLLNFSPQVLQVQFEKQHKTLINSSYNHCHLDDFPKRVQYPVVVDSSVFKEIYFNISIL